MNGSVKLGTPSACAHASMSSALSAAMFEEVEGENSLQNYEFEKRRAEVKWQSWASVPSVTSLLGKMLT